MAISFKRALGATVVLSAAFAASVANAEQVKIGLSSAFSGPNAAFGQDARAGIEMAIDELSKQGGNIAYSLAIADDECTPAGGAQAFRRLTDIEGVNVILGSLCSGATLAGMETLKDSEVPAVTFGSTNAKITELAGVGGNPFMWRMNLSDLVIGEIYTKYIADQKVKNVAVLAVNNDYGRGAVETYKPLLAANGINVKDFEYFNLGVSDLRPQLTKIAAAKPDAVIFFGEYHECGLLVRQKQELGLDAKIYARGTCATDEGLKAMGGSMANGLVEGSYWARTDQQPFVREYQAKYGGLPPFSAALAYYAMMTVNEAVKIGGASSKGIQDGLAKVNWRSAIGPIAFDEHHQAHPDLFLMTIEGGNLKLLAEIPTK